ncbi:hypothetical protein [Halorarum salinum]|uniref:Uncharacterized protein n=1 Tax=Halorarum salinum TaxID=2743089 RepID=A0A7D5LBM1_9EURY|nr:hypothetical protein [Halobaculum salinum]QLG62852.1 hypothetical protein HUG12_14390 [Halobaculum salinum]
MNENHDMILEARNRDRWEDKEAYGEIDGEKVYLVAELRDGKYPKLVAMVGGEWYHYPEDDLEDEYVRHTKVTKSYDRVDMLNTGFSALVEKHGLVEELPEEWKMEDDDV